ncbi:MAG: alpha/beta fold hydrolase [Pseudomonadota bacterium]
MKASLTAWLLATSFATSILAEESPVSDTFFDQLNQLCGARFVGESVFPEDPGDAFRGQQLVAEFSHCDGNQVRIPFAVGEDRSRTWILTRQEDGGLLFKHDHRHADGTPDEITNYGGFAAGPGSPLSQSFPADAFTAELIPEAATNVWTLIVSADGTELTYDLTRRGAPRFRAILRRSAADDAPKPVVIVHGAWGGGWDWRETAAVLEELGHDVYRPSLTGLGEREHLYTDDVDLGTHVTDIVNVLRWEALEDVILVGHSYGGMVITGVAEVVPERIGRLVYLDAFVPFDGECALAVGRDESPRELCTPRAARELLGPEARTGRVSPSWIEDGTPPPTDIPHPVRTFIERLELAGEPGRGLPARYIITRETAGGADDFNVAAERAAKLGWTVVEYVGDHVPYRENPAGIARLFIE